MASEKAGNPPPYQPESVNFVDGPPPPIVPGPAMVPMVPVAMVQMAPQVGSQPQGMRCRSCNAEIVTAIKHNSTTKTHLFAALLCIIGCWPCVCIPYCMDSCKNIDHYCPNCDAYIGTYKG